MSGNSNHQLAELVKAYRMPEKAVELLSQHPPLMIAGVTAAGKNSIVKYLQESGGYRHVITHTTRPPRTSEKSGETYTFVSGEQMVQLITGNDLIEANAVHGETVYGTSIKAYESVIEAGHKPMMIIDVQGVEDITKNIPKLKAVFLLPPSFETWMERLDKRGVMSHIERQRRLKSARVEMEHALNNSHFALYVNRDIHTTAQAILSDSVVPAEQHHNRELALRLIDHIKAY